jgi:hypothetical protein
MVVQSGRDTVVLLIVKLNTVGPHVIFKITIGGDQQKTNISKNITIMVDQGTFVIGAGAIGVADIFICIAVIMDGNMSH